MLTRLYDLATAGDEDARVCRDIPESAGLLIRSATILALRGASTPNLSSGTLLVSDIQRRWFVLSLE